MGSRRLPEDVVLYADHIEAEMRRIGFWQNQPLPPEQMKFTQAFGMDTMTFAQWLQFVFLPRVREAAAANQFPASSSVGAQAVREFDGDPQADDLVTLLAEFDSLFDQRTRKKFSLLLRAPPARAELCGKSSRERLQEGKKTLLFSLGKVEPGHQLRFVLSIVTAAVVVVDHGFQSRQAAVVHVRSMQGHAAQSRSLEG